MRRSRRSDRAQPATKRPPGEGFQPSVRGIFFSCGSVFRAIAPLAALFHLFFFALWLRELPFQAFFFRLWPYGYPFHPFFSRLRPQNLPREAPFDPIRPQMLHFIPFGTSRAYYYSSFHVFGNFRFITTYCCNISGFPDRLILAFTSLRDFPKYRIQSI